MSASNYYEDEDAWAVPPDRMPAPEVDDLLSGPAALTVADAPSWADQAQLVQTIGVVRDVKLAVEQAVWVGKALGPDAYYRWVQGGEVVEGGTVELAYSLLPVWKGVATRVVQVSREGTHVLLRATAADLLAATFVERDYSFTLPPAGGKYAKSDAQRNRWEAMQMGAAASRAVRNCILRVIPAYVVRAAVQAAKRSAQSAVLVGRGGVTLTLEQAKQAAIRAWEGRGFTDLHLAGMVGGRPDTWSVDDLVTLRQRWPEASSGALLPSHVDPLPYLPDRALPPEESPVAKQPRARRRPEAEGPGAATVLAVAKEEKRIGDDAKVSAARAQFGIGARLEDADPGVLAAYLEALRGGAP